MTAEKKRLIISRGEHPYRVVSLDKYIHKQTNKNYIQQVVFIDFVPVCLCVLMGFFSHSHTHTDILVNV